MNESLRGGFIVMGRTPSSLLVGTNLGTVEKEIEKTKDPGPLWNPNVRVLHKPILDFPRDTARVC